MVALPTDSDVDSREVVTVYDGLVAKAESFDNDKMGMSEVGKECDRAIWYSWRWCSPAETFTGPKLRIFATGHLHEDMILDHLEAAGMKVSRFDPDAKLDRHGKHGQWEVRGLDGHLKGKLDARIWNVPSAPATEHVGEIKTHNDKSWKKVKKDGVEKAKPEHYGQMQLYMHFRQLTRALYVAENKNDSQLYTERVEYNVTYCMRLLGRLEMIRDSRTPPTKLHEDPDKKAAFACRWCKSLKQCHGGEFARNNCRTCLHSTPISGGKWHCARWNREITYLEQREGCGAHLFIPELVPGEQVDCDPEAETVTYILDEDGSEYVDGGSSAKEEPQVVEEPKKIVVMPQRAAKKTLGVLGEPMLLYWHHPESCSLFTTWSNEPDPRGDGTGDAALVEEIDADVFAKLSAEYSQGLPCETCGGAGTVLRTLFPADMNGPDAIERNELNGAIETNTCEDCAGVGRRSMEAV